MDASLVEERSEVDYCGWEAGRLEEALRSDPLLGRVIGHAEWELLVSGSWRSMGFTGCVALLRLAGRVEVEGVFADFLRGASYSARVVAGGLHVFYDRGRGRVVLLDPLLGGGEGLRADSGELARVLEFAGRLWGEAGEARLVGEYSYGQLGSLRVYEVLTAGGAALVGVEPGGRIVERFTGLAVPGRRATFPPTSRGRGRPGRGLSAGLQSCPPGACHSTTTTSSPRG